MEVSAALATDGGRTSGLTSLAGAGELQEGASRIGLFQSQDLVNGLRCTAFDARSRYSCSFADLLPQIQEALCLFTRVNAMTDERQGLIWLEWAGSAQIVSLSTRSINDG